jgi:hypothetical protein
VESSIAGREHYTGGPAPEFALELVARREGAADTGLIGEGEFLLALEELVFGDIEDLDQPEPCAGRGVGMPAVQQVRPMPAREPELDGPVVLADGGAGGKLAQLLGSEAKTQRIPGVAVVRLP